MASQQPSTSRLTSDRRRHSETNNPASNNALNPRRIQTGLPGIRRTVYDGALRVNSDAYDVLSGVVRDVHANTSSAAVADTNNSNNAAGTNLSLQAKPEWRKHFPLNALLRPTTNSSTHDEFHIATTTTKKQQRRSTVLVTELTNETVITHQPRIVNEVTGERAMCAVESVVTKGRNVEVAVLDLGEEEHLEEEEENGQEAGGGGGQQQQEEKEVVSIRGGGDGNEGNTTGDGDVVMEEGGAAVVEKKHDDDVNMAEAPVNTAASAVEGGEVVAVDTNTTTADVTSTAAVDNTTVAATTTTAVAPSAVEGGSVDAIEAKPVEAVASAVEGVASVPSAQSGSVADEIKEVATQQQQQSTTSTVAVADTSTAATATTDDKSQEVAPSVNAVGEQGGGGGVADAPTSSSPTAQVDTNAAAATVSAPDVASAPTATTTPAAAETTTTAHTTSEATTVKSTTIHPLPSNHPPLSTSILPTTTTIITPPQNAPSWYHPTTISTMEKSSLPEWFNSSAPHRTSTTYLSTRNQILNIYHAQLSSSSNTTTADTAATTTTATVYLTPTAIRRCVPGDVGSLLRLHSFLCDWGLINGKDLGENTPSELALRGGSTTTSSSGGVGGKRKLQDEKRSVFWNKERLEQLDGVVVKYVRVTQTTVSGGAVEGAPQQQHQLPSVDWDAVAKDIGEGVSASDCQRAFLDPPSTDEVSAKIAKTSSSSGLDLSTILDGVHPDVLNATISASLKATNDITMARKASIAGILASTAATKAHSEEEEIARTLMDILDQRMQRLENRVAILDDVEALMEAERVALELERRDMYTTRCRHWFGDGSS